MSLPNATLAIVERQKIVDYLLNPAHPDNGGKARFFVTLGFDREQWEILAAALHKMAMNVLISTKSVSSHGEKYVLEGEIETPCGKMPHLRAIWIIDRGSDKPRLVTCYPTE